MRLLLLLSLLVIGEPSTAQSVQSGLATTGSAVTLDATARQSLVEGLGQALRDRYVFVDVGAAAAVRIRSALDAGEYDALADPAAFAARLTDDLRSIAHDKHMAVVSLTNPPASPAVSGPLPRAEAGITRADKLAGGIGYIEVIGFPSLASFRPAVDRAMAGLKGSRILIIDDRRNGGGDPTSVAYFISYLLAPGQPITTNEFVNRTPGTTTFTRESFRTERTSINFAGVPVYVLTSKNTFSGGEEFAYDVQALKRATIVGEVTGGGANRVGPVDLGHGMLAAIPFGRVENPVTKANWEGRGVQPDVNVAASDALATALGKAGQKPVADVAAASVLPVFTLRSAPLPGTELALRKLVTGFAAGELDYSIMAVEFAAFIRPLAPQARSLIESLGSLRSLSFLGPTPDGGDEYKIVFANGSRKAGIQLNEDGKIISATPLTPLAPGE
jgi:hypothetical protein